VVQQNLAVWAVHPVLHLVDAVQPEVQVSVAA
jgi:hypothetical protein